MLVDTKCVMDKVLSELETDATLSGYVKSFTQGDMNLARKKFPFVSIGNFSYREKQLLAASGIFIYSVDIYAGTKNLAAGVAYLGNDSGKKGIVELCHDIRKVIEDNSFSGTFLNTPAGIRINPRHYTDKAEMICIGKISFEGEVWFRH